MSSNTTPPNAPKKFTIVDAVVAVLAAAAVVATVVAAVVEGSVNRDPQLRLVTF